MELYKITAKIKIQYLFSKIAILYYSSVDIQSVA